ncbi:uncharacterized protein zgc:66455 isoform X2 [Mugil cephalus]|uniref:uncharacterized protein zgc:66455 isoform X2 n=1 Tax=Mugil cephalus TaxID=48193 RepID=UPI001FB60110|nr:uncharacterized protein zgc:66455 isoform X2 [Mugil cephalus]
MPQKKSLNLKSTQLVFLLLLGFSWRLCDAQTDREEDNRPPDGHGGDGSAFFALRSCHQLLHGDSGEFFSPDYLCSNPPLWCNWTIQVDAGKRIHLHLEDLTPDDTCHLKQDQIHVDEPVGHLVSHKVLQKCWQEAKYTSSSNALYVVLLIGGWPSPLYRGFYGRYQAFGPPVVYNPGEGSSEGREESELLTQSPALMEVSEPGPVMNSDKAESANSNVMYDYYDQHLAMAAEEAADTDGEIGENLCPSTAAATVPAPTQGTLRSERDVLHPSSVQLDSVVYSTPSQQQHDRRHLEPSTTRTSTVTQRNELEAVAAKDEGVAWSRSDEEKSANDSERAGDGGNEVEVEQVSDELPSPSERPELPQPNAVEPLLDHRVNVNTKNLTEIPHLPGGHLFEVAIEVNFSLDLEESWDNLARSLLMSVKGSISEKLEGLYTQVAISSKRIKRLHAGALYILWLQSGHGPGGVQAHRALHSALQGLIAKAFDLGGNHRTAIIMSVSTADVNECGTQLVLCDTNADCMNEFGSYSCRCRPGFEDESRLGSGGTICVDVKAAAPSS